jgi:trehalose synthase
VAKVAEVSVQACSIDELAGVLGPEREADFRARAAAARSFLDGRTVLNVNSTAAGGGVAEMLQTLLSYARGAGVDTRWVVIQGDPEFFTITKRLHNHLYGAPGDGGPLGAAEHRAYESTLRDNAAELRALVRPGDLVVLHDPQTAGLLHAVRDAGATVVWRCHVGIDTPNEYSEHGWDFLRPYVEDADAYVFTLRSFAPPWADPDRVHVIAPSIDPFSTKNRDLSPEETGRILRYAGLLSDGAGADPATFVRRDGSPGRVEHHADILQTGPPPPTDVPIVTQVSRWDRMKDMPGVMAGFAEHVEHAHLVLAGPVVTGVTDDPEGGQVLEECVEQWRGLPHAVRARVHLACIPMHDPDENATIVNALQRHAAIVTQKSIAEGFGLTVVEAMWKGRPIVASAVGGISEQIVAGEHGLLLDDPLDLDAFGQALCGLLDDPTRAATLGANARRRASEEFLGDRHLEQWAGLFAHLQDGTGR